MLRWAVVFFAIAIAAALCGFTGIAGAASEIARVIFFVFLVVFIASFVGHVLMRPGARAWRG
jgi:uncharacterized membrane protein YtjA (UPF0391 family)